MEIIRRCQSDNYKSITFTTLGASGCIFASSEAYNVGTTGNHSSRIFQAGYRVTITGDENEFTIVAYTDDDFYQLDPPYIQILNDPGNPTTSGVTERLMAVVVGEERTYSYTFSKTGDANHKLDPWAGTITFFVKYPFNDGGICLTQPIEYDILNGCGSPFVIYHHDDKPTASAITTFDGGMINQPISYYRHFTAGVWEDITVPFEVEKIRVYDTEDHKYYDLTAQYNDGSVHKGNFLLRKQQDNVSGENFVPGWYDGNTALPQKDQPYAIRFTSSYYADKYIVFTGAKNQTISSSFTKGTAPTADNQYQAYGNSTMQYQNVDKAYLLPVNHSDETYRLSESAAVRPFETYVLANANTMQQMHHIAPWRGAPLVATGMDEAGSIEIYEQIVVFSLSGQKMGEWKNITVYDAADACQGILPPGCYIIQAGAKAAKMVVR